MNKLSIGIVGLPNVGKSTLFKIITQQEVNIANYPFCTIDPNIGVVTVPDERLDKLSQMSQSAKTIPAVVEFYDIAGLVKGANQGAGLGNKFLSHIREVNAIIMVLRCFPDSEIIHVENSIDPWRDLEIINDELALKDLETVEKINKRDIGPKEIAVFNKIKERLNKNELITDLAEEPIVKNLQLLTAKKQLYLLNGQTKDVGEELKNKIKELGGDYIIVNLGEIATLHSAEGSRNDGLNSLIKKAYEILDLISFFTTGEKESRAWTIRRGLKAPQAAGVIHTDFEKGFIKAEVINWEKLLQASSWAQAKSKGLIKLEGKEYVVRDGDVIIIKHS